MEFELTTDATLNGGSITVTVYEDTTGSGDPDNQASWSVDSGSNTYTLAGFDGSSGNDIWLKADFSDAIESTPELHSAEVAASGGGGGGVTETVAFGGASDWDSATSEKAVVHEDRFDLPGANVATLGYPSFDRGGSDLIRYYPMAESNSPSTISDVTGNEDLSVQGSPTFGATGLHGAPAIDFPGSNNDYLVGANDYPETSELTFMAIVSYEDSTAPNSDAEAISNYNRNSGEHFGIRARSSTGYEAAFTAEGNNFGAAEGNTDIVDNGFYLIVGRFDASSDNDVFLDGTHSGSGSNGGTTFNTSTTSDFLVGRGGEIGDAVGEPWPGRIQDVRVWSRGLSDSEISELADIILSGGHVQTPTKSFSEPVQPNLQNLAYSLNGEEIVLDVIGSPGTASEEVQSITLDGSTSFSIAWSNAHTDFQVKVNLNIAAKSTSRPEFTSGELYVEGDDSDSDQNPNTTWEIQGAKHDTSGNEYEGGGVVARYDA